MSEHRNGFSGLRPKRPEKELRERVLSAAAAASAARHGGSVRHRSTHGWVPIGWVWAATVVLLLALHGLLTIDAAVERREVDAGLAVVGGRGPELGSEDAASWRLLSLARVERSSWP